MKLPEGGFIMDDNEQQEGLSNVEILKLINNTFGTNYTSINTYDLLEALKAEWNKVEE